MRGAVIPCHHASSGSYSVDNGHFATATTTLGPLTAAKNGSGDSNGLPLRRGSRFRRATTTPATIGWTPSSRRPDMRSTV